MLRSIGLPEILVVLIVGGLLLFLFWKVFTKAGYPGYFALAMFIPIVNLALWCFLAFAEWPVLKELKALRQSASSARGPVS
jgi:hypothetical protein